MSDPAAEYAAVRRSVGLIDRSDLGIVEVTGRDRAAFLHAMLSNEVKSLTAGRGTTAAFLDVQGKVQTLLILWALEDRLLLLAPPGEGAKTIEKLDHYLFSEKAYFKDVTGEMALLMLAGPDAPKLVEQLTGTAAPETAWSHTAARLAEVDVRLVRGGGETGEAEVWIASTVADAERVRVALREAGATTVGRVAWESLRVEAGTLAYGSDVDTTVLLPEIPIERLVSYTKGCYIGQEVVVRIRDRGHVNRHLRGLVIDGPVPPASGSPVVADGAEVGRVTSSTWSFGLKRPIALGFIRRQHADPGTLVTVRAGGAELAATVSALPFTQ
ncbi:MAG: glycine cleavage system protein T [Candidatus Rokuibacteriota bacterium]|nr:MAG: glycine cleavage system protein T [Candidatus Rokubacteria bacterium]